MAQRSRRRPVRVKGLPTQYLARLARMTPTMWDMLRSVERYKGGYSRTTDLKILARRGLIEMEPRPDPNGFYRARLTEAGVEALRALAKRRGR